MARYSHAVIALALPLTGLSAQPAAAPSASMMVVDTGTRKAWRLPQVAYYDPWWLDDEHLVSVGGGVMVVSPPVPGRIRR